MVLPFFNFNVSGQHNEDKKQRQTDRIPYFFITAFLLLPENESCCFLDALQAQKDFHYLLGAQRHSWIGHQLRRTTAFARIATLRHMMRDINSLYTSQTSHGTQKYQKTSRLSPVYSPVYSKNCADQAFPFTRPSPHHGSHRSVCSLFLPPKILN